MLSPACIRSKPLLISSRLSRWVIMGSISMRPSMYQSTMRGTSVRPRAPPNAVPFQTRPVTSWEGAGGDLLATLSHADDDALAPAAMAAFQRLAHHLNITGAVEAVVRTAAGQAHQMLDHVAHIARVHEVGQAELPPPPLLVGVDVDADDLGRADHLRALDDIEADAAEAEHNGRSNPARSSRY